ncbi:MAG: hypothetical protein ACTSQY_00135 [Candidatus Odinarchaeia archaeon]|nr:MAG: hypothetical protein [Lokiarchaeota virus Fenrir Meg22_1012]URC17206.1 MAG: hypothetical protein [Lokiarchaeota virus Fenrir Meg22_1214]
MTRQWVFRGSQTTDWNQSTLPNQDGNWHDLDISSKVPVGTKIVLLRMGIGRETGRQMWVRKDDGSMIAGFVHNPGASFVCWNRAQVFCGVTEERTIQYRVSSSGAKGLDLTVAAWYCETTGSKSIVFRSGTVPNYDQRLYSPDGNWHSIDLSSVVPSGATAVYVRLNYNASTINQPIFRVRRNSTASFEQYCAPYNGTKQTYVFLPCNTNRSIEARVDGHQASYMYPEFLVLGWYI